MKTSAVVTCDHQPDRRVHPSQAKKNDRKRGDSRISDDTAQRHHTGRHNIADQDDDDGARNSARVLDREKQRQPAGQTRDNTDGGDGTGRYGTSFVV